MTGNRVKFAFPAVFTVVFLAIPLLTRDPFILHVLIMLGIGIILATSLLLTLRIGAMNFGLAGFIAIGAYASAILVAKWGISFWIALPLAGVAAAVVAAVFGFPTLRVKGIYFVMLVFAFGEIVRLFFENMFEGVLGGSMGIRDIPYPSALSIPGLLNIDFSASKVPFYYLTLVATLVTVIAIWQIGRSRIGLTFWSIKESDGVAEHCGINLLRYKVLAFAISSFFVGIGGSLTAHYHGVILPADFTSEMTFTSLTYVVVGGISSVVSGPIVGSIAITSAHEALGGLPYYRAILFGVLIIVAVVFVPQGIAGLLKQIPSAFKGLGSGH